MNNRDRNILSLLLRKGPLSNQDLSNELGIAPSAVTASALGLLNQDAVTLVEAKHYSTQTQSGRRKKKTYVVNPEYGFGIVIGIEYDSLIVHKVAFDLSLIETRRIPVKQYNRQVILSLIRKELQSMRTSIEKDSILGIGFSMPGQVDAHQGIAIHSTRIEDWDNVDFEQFKEFSDNIVVENVANAITIGEHICGSAINVDNFLLLHVGNGAGMGIMIAGNLHRGHNNAAGEAGHVIVDESSGTTCNCGNRGCLESYVSCRAVTRELERLRSSEVPSGILSDPSLGDGPEVFRLLGEYYKNGDKVAYLVVEELAHKLGLAASNFAQILDPACIVVSGPISDIGEHFLELVQQNIMRYHLPWLARVPVVYGQNENLSNAQGVAYLVFSNSWEQ